MKKSVRKIAVFWIAKNFAPDFADFFRSYDE